MNQQNQSQEQGQGQGRAPNLPIGVGNPKTQWVQLGGCMSAWLAELRKLANQRYSVDNEQRMSVLESCIAENLLIATDVQGAWADTMVALDKMFVRRIRRAIELQELAMHGDEKIDREYADIKNEIAIVMMYHIEKLESKK